MNDRFLFRVWYKGTKKFFYGIYPGVLSLPNTKNTKAFILEQCTGLVDKNGEHIYEGDMLLLDPDDPPASVVWNEDVAMFCLVQEDVCYTFDNCGYSPQEMEVIGNIHKNPELLGDK